MLNESVIMLSLVAASLTPLKTNYHAKNDKPEDAVYMHSAYKAIPKDSSVNETDVYTLNFYKEKEYKEITPIVQYCKLKRALEEQELSFTLEQTIEKTFSETSIVSNALSLTAGGGIDLGNIATVGAELELNANNTYKNTFHFSKSQTVTTTSTYKKMELNTNLVTMPYLNLAKAHMIHIVSINIEKLQIMDKWKCIKHCC